MTSEVMHVLVTFLLLSGTLLAQTVESPCEVPAEVRSGLAAWDHTDDAVTPYEERHASRERIVAQFLEKFPDEITLHQRRQRLMKGAMERYGFSAPIEEYRKLADSHPGHPAYQFLYAKAIYGFQTKEAIQLLDDVLVRHPGFAPARLELARVYSWGIFKDIPNAVSQLEAYHQTCPASLDGFSLGRRLNDQPYLERSATRLRKLLSATEDPDRLRHYETLWALEFRARPASGHGALREQVAQDLKRLESLKPPKTITWLRLLQGGRRLLNDQTAIAQIDDRMALLYPDSRTTLRAQQRRFFQQNPYPRTGIPEDLQVWSQKATEAAEGVIRRWPKSPEGYSMKMGALRALEHPPAEEIAATADKLLETYALHPDAFRGFPPVHYQVAEAYLQAGTRFDRVPELILAGTAELSESRDLDLASDTVPPGQNRGGNYSQTFTEGGPLLVESYLRRDLTDDARRAIRDMEKYLASNRPGRDATDRDRARFKARQAILPEMRGKLAEHENRTADAVALYLTAAALNPRPSRPRPHRVSPAERAQTLWRKIGGTAEGLQALSENGVHAEDQPSVGWTAVTTPLPDFEITDTSGRIWRLADLRGKTTFVNLWATWCGWCHPELPHVQDLHERFQDRKDVLLLTLNLDDNPGLIQSYLEEHGYTFPVLPARALAEQLMPRLSLPRNWIVSPDAQIVWEQRGFNLDESPEEWLEKKVMQLVE